MEVVDSIEEEEGRREDGGREESAVERVSYESGEGDRARRSWRAVEEFRDLEGRV